MRYIRTKDGRIFENHDKLQIIDNTLCNMQNGRVWVVLGQVLKQSDTIEELCDFKVIIDEHCGLEKNGVPMITTLPLEDIRVPNFERVYGAILTDKAIIFIAKMNEKGELELI